MKKHQTNDSDQTRARRRISKMGNVELFDWADAAGNGLFKAFQDYRTHGHVESLEEIGYAVIALQSVVDELLQRHKV